jgi:hypothetical protein
MAIAPSAQPCNHAFETLRQKWIMKELAPLKRRSSALFDPYTGSGRERLIGHVTRDRSTDPMVLRIGKVLPTPIAAAVCNAGRQ